MTVSDPLSAGISPEAIDEIPESGDPPAEPWHGLHPKSLLVNLIPQMWRTLKSLWPLLLIVFFGGEGMGIAVGEIGLVFIFLLMSISGTVVHFMTLRYRMAEGRLEIRQGLLHKRTRVIDPARIQNLELVQNLFHKAAGLVELKVETAGNVGTEGLLSALAIDEAQRLQRLLKEVTDPEILLEEDHEHEALITNGVPELLAYGLSQRRLGAVALMMAVAFEVLGQMRPDRAAEVMANTLDAKVLLAAFMVAMAASWALSAGRAVLQYFNYRLLLKGDTLVTEAGLTTRRRVEIPLRKVQLARVDEPMLRRWMGFGTVHIETAGLGVSEGRLSQAEGVIPMVERESLGSTVLEATPLAQIDPWQVRLKPAAPRALYRGIIQRMIRFGLVAGVITGLFFPYGGLAFALVPLALPVAYLDWRMQGWMVTPDAVVSRRGFFNRRTWVIARDKLQSVHLVQGPIMRWHKLARVGVRVAGSSVALPDLKGNDALDILEELSRGWHAEDPTTEAMVAAVEE